MQVQMDHYNEGVAEKAPEENKLPLGGSKSGLPGKPKAGLRTDEVHNLLDLNALHLYEGVKTVRLPWYGTCFP